MAMLSLIIDTSHDSTYLILSRATIILETRVLPRDQKQSLHLIPSLQALLNDHKLLPSSLGFIGIGIGPGSFLGTRLGVVCAKSLSFALNIPLVPFNSLLGYVPLDLPSTPFIILSDAKSKGFYAFKGTPGTQLCFENSCTLITPEELITNIAQNSLCLIAPDTQTSRFKPLNLQVTFNSFQPEFLLKYCLNRFSHHPTPSIFDLKIPYFSS